MKGEREMPEQEYPTDDELDAIESWPLGDPRGLVDFIESIWSHNYGKMIRTSRRIKLITGGWSGNEDVISALHKNIWGIEYWVRSVRGGYHEYEMPPQRMQSAKYTESGRIVRAKVCCEGRTE